MCEPAPAPPQKTFLPPKNQRAHLGVFSCREREGQERPRGLFLRKLSIPTESLRYCIPGVPNSQCVGGGYLPRHQGSGGQPA